MNSISPFPDEHPQRQLRSEPVNLAPICRDLAVLALLRARRRADLVRSVIAPRVGEAIEHLLQTEVTP